MEISSDTKWHEITSAESLKKLSASEKGLSENEAQARLSRLGYNELVKEKGISKAAIFIAQFKSILVIILIGATLFSALIGELLDAAAIIMIVVLNAIFGFIQEYKAEKTIEALKKLTSPEALVLRDGEERKIDSRLLVPGDIIILEEGSRVPADMRVIQDAELKIDEAILTGESAPVSKDPAPSKAASIADRKNMAYMGTLVTYGRGVGVVVATGMRTEMGKIAKVVQAEEEQTTPLQKRLGAFGKKLGLLILVICVMVIVIGIVREGPLAGKPLTEGLIVMIVITGIALAVAAIPEGLPAVMTITLALGLQRLAKSNALMRRLPAVEALGSTTVICSDKTGTLTKNEMTVSRLWHPDAFIEITGEGYRPEGRLVSKGKDVGSKMRDALSFMLKVGALCTNARLQKNGGEYSIMGDPTEGSIVVAAQKLGLIKEEIEARHERLHEIPFSSERKMMTTINKMPGRAVMCCAKGATEVILEHCDNILAGGGSHKITRAWKERIAAKNQEMASDALRVLAIAYKETGKVDTKTAESGLTFIGLVGMIDPPREEAKESVKVCRKAGIRVIMITGDHRNTAIAIARQLGLMDGNGRAITGEELDTISDEALARAVKEVAVYARVNPIHKVRIVDALKKNGEIIAMTGDGVNDAPALKKADIGIAMGIKGTDVAKEASDMILTDDNFTSIVRAVHEGRAIYDNIKNFIQYLLSSNVGEVLIVFFAILVGFQDPSTLEIILPVAAIQLLWINLLTDGLPALALGVDPASSGIMERPPRDPKENILTRAMAMDILLFGALMCIGTLLLFDLSLPYGKEKAMTVAFTAIVMFEMVRVESVRSKHKLGILSNKKLLIAVASSILLQLVIIYVPFFNPVFETLPLALSEWAWIVAASAMLFVIMWIKGRVVKGRPWD
jgi:Ca2+-transporting ATPase